MELEPIGRAENPEALNLEPIVAPIVAYTHDGKEHVEKFPFKPVMPAGAMAAMVRNVGPNGELPVNILLACLQRCLMPDAAERWETWIDSDELNIEHTTLAQLFDQLVRIYGDRPTRRRSGSASGGPPAKRTSRAAARSAASRSKTSRS